MSIATGLMIYAILWWLVLFMVLPFGIRTPEEVNEEPGPGHAPSAPVHPRLWLKAAVTTVISGLIFGAIYAAVALGYLDLRAYFLQSLE